MTTVVTCDGREPDALAHSISRSSFAFLSATGDRGRLDYKTIAAELHITADSARQNAHRLRNRYRELLREEVARTVAVEGDVDEELASLLAALGNA